MSKKLQSLFNVLSKNKSSVVFLKKYTEGVFTKKFLVKLKKSRLEADRLLHKKFTTKDIEVEVEEEDKNDGLVDGGEKTNNVGNNITLPTVIKRVREPSNVNTTLYRVWRPCIKRSINFQFKKRVKN